MSTQILTHYFDYKSPYAYLAQEPTLALPSQYEVELRLVPYTLDIPSFLGSAEVDDRKSLVASERNAHQWRRVKYSYMDCRREANRRGLVIRGPRKIFDSTIAHIGFLYAEQHGDPVPYHLRVYEKFWRRELDIEDPAMVQAELEAAGIPPDGFGDYLHDEGRDRLESLQAQGEDQGVFGVPSFVVGGELYWGLERLARACGHLTSREAST